MEGSQAAAAAAPTSATTPHTMRPMKLESCGVRGGGGCSREEEAAAGMLAAGRTFSMAATVAPVSVLCEKT